MTKKRPNVLFILSDDQGAWAMHCAGMSELHTPNLDRIAANGMRFDDFFCVSPVCSPARASLLTGTIPSVHGVHDWIRRGSVDSERFAKAGKENPYGGYEDERKPIQYLKGRTAYTDVLAESGYLCALSGKWHLGDSVNPQHGFQRWFTIGKGGCYYYHPDIVENGSITVRHGEYVTDVITNRALEYLEEFSQNREQPFYLSVHYTAPHDPWGEEHHPKEYIDMYNHCKFDGIPDVPDHPDRTGSPVYGTNLRRENLRGYFAAITAMDANIGRLLDCLEAGGLLEDTVVIFTADNGMSMGHHGVWGKGNGTFPMNMYDTAVKVPFLISYPPVIPKGKVNTDMVSAYDVYPTLLDLLDLPMESCQRLPGKSFLAALQGKNMDCLDREVVIFDEYGPVRMIRTRTHKYIHRYPYGPHEFYDLVQDPREERNLIRDPASQEKILQMRRRLEQWFLRWADPARDGTREGVTGAGQLTSPGPEARSVEKYAPLPQSAAEWKKLFDGRPD